MPFSLLERAPEDYLRSMRILGGLLIVGAAACTKGDSSSASPGPEADLPPDDATAAAGRAACQYVRGAMPRGTLGTSAPLGAQIPIDTIVVLMLENRSFDHYFSHLNRYAKRNDIESAADSTILPDKTGATPGLFHPYAHAPHLCLLDTNHEWSGTHLEWDDGKMDGFVEANEGFAETFPDGGAPMLKDGARSLGWFDERDIPFYYELASKFAIGDHYHSSILGPTWPNRQYLYAASSYGVIDNSFPDFGDAPYPQKDVVIFDMLEKAKISWEIYGDGVPGAATAVSVAIVNRWGAHNPLHPAADFFTAAAAGTLPHVVFLDPHLGNEGPARDDEHPPADVQVGQRFTSDVVHALFKSPQWSRTALFITYDEHGGLYDHVAPPRACAPDDRAPLVHIGDLSRGAFDRYGMRVPMTVVSPYAKPAYVSHVLYDHTSILRFIEARYDLPALTARDANAGALLDFFDFTTASFATPPELTEPTIDPVELEYCEITFRK
jgi:phospholipase C